MQPHASAAGDFVRIVEVGPRDGLQNESAMVATADKIELVDRLSATGLRSIEATSFVSPRWVPQLADAAEVMAGIHRRPGVSYPVLVPNEQGYERARAAGADEVAVFTAASEAFNRRNINASIDESIERFAPVLARAREDGVRVRGYVSTVLGCPYQGEVPVAEVVRVARRRHLTVVAAESWGLRRADGTHHHVGFGMVTWPVHDAREAVRARRAGADVLFVSPLFPTRSHPGARAKGPVRARLAAGRGPGVLIALGGMDERRFRRVRPLGFAGYAAIDAWAAGPASGQKRKAVPT